MGKCPFPEHHGPDGGPGLLLPLGVAVAAVALCAGVITSIIHILSIVITFTGIAALAVGGGWVWWRFTHRAVPVWRQTEITQQQRPAGRQLPYQQQPELEQGGIHQHVHLHGSDAVSEYYRRRTGA